MTAESGARAPITTEAVRDLLSDPKIFPGLSPRLDDDAELVLDSLGLVWFLHQLELRYGLEIDPADADGFTSVRRITEYLAGLDEP
ncbi:MAG: acyl carrier protein [Nocardiopsaceae bacterium]|nr:acyl carrier protein [Nocardiopsaceae bacterium]